MNSICAGPHMGPRSVGSHGESLVHLSKHTAIHLWGHTAEGEQAILPLGQGRRLGRTTLRTDEACCLNPRPSDVAAAAATPYGNGAHRV